MVDFLADRARKDSASGAVSLAHLLVLVPTAQSARRLRAALARRFGALVPPYTMQPRQLFAPESTTARTDELIAMTEALGKEGDLDYAARLCDVRTALEDAALGFAEVAEKVAQIIPGEAVDVEEKRWRMLAEIEVKFVAALKRRGKVDRLDVIREKIRKPEISSEVECIVLGGVLTLPAAAKKVLEASGLEVEEVLPGRVAPEDVSKLSREQIHPCGTAASEAESIAEYFATVGKDEELPALCPADPSLITHLKSAFEAKGMRLVDPSTVALSVSSLGHLVSQLADLVRTRSYDVFSAFIRTGDVRRYLKEALQVDEAEIAALLVDLDNRQAEYLPETIDDIASKTTGKLRAVFEHFEVKLRKKGVRGTLQAIFKSLTLDERNETCREFAAAAEKVRELLDECFAPDVPENLRNHLFAKRLEETTYSLEDDEGESVVADGWMELLYSDADEIVLSGFNEGFVPESVVGHAYLPDALRSGLGLETNADRTNRDRRLLNAVLESRDQRAVRVYFHSVDDRGDVLKPSRLLFEGVDDKELCARVNAYYGVHAGTGESSPADLPAEWKLKLPIPPEYEKLVKVSPTRLDGYLRCPFTYFLRRKDVLGDKRMDDRASELASWEYGNLAHEALEKWGLSELKDSEDVEAIRRFLEEDVDRQLTERFGMAIPAIVLMQGESVKRRLANFAAVQVAWHQEGWRIVAAEKKLEVTIGHTRFHGKCDRVDRNVNTGKWCVIDNKTSDRAERAKAYDEKKEEWLSLQLPIYCSMLEVCSDAEVSGVKRDDISATYCVLGATADDVKFTTPMTGAMVPQAEKKILELIPLIERGIFWPPGDSGEWRWDYEDWLYPDPETAVSEDWLADQKSRAVTCQT